MTDQHPSKKGGKQPPYEDWTKDELYDRAQEIGIEGRSDMTKDELIDALRGLSASAAWRERRRSSRRHPGGARAISWILEVGSWGGRCMRRVGSAAELGSRASRAPGRTGRVRGSISRDSAAIPSA